MSDVDGEAFPYSRYLALHDELACFHKENFPRWPLRIHRDPDGSGYSIQDGAGGITVRINEDSFHQLMHGMLALHDTTLQEADAKDLSWAMLQAAQAWIRHRALPNDAMIFCQDPLRYALIAPGLLEYFQREHRSLLPTSTASAKSFDFEPYRGHGLVLITADRLWERWNAWSWTIFEYDLIRNRSTGDTAMQLKQVVPRWNPTDLFLFACDLVESSLHYYRQVRKDDTVLRHAIDVMRRFARGEATNDEVAAAHAEVEQVVQSLAAWQARQGDMEASPAGDAAGAVLWLTTPDEDSDLPGRNAREAAHLAYQAGCRNPGGWIAAKILGRYREADLLEYLGVGSPEERDAVRNGRLLDGTPRGARAGLKMSDLTVVDFTRDEDEL